MAIIPPLNSLISGVQMPGINQIMEAIYGQRYGGGKRRGGPLTEEEGGGLEERRERERQGGGGGGNGLGTETVENGGGGGGNGLGTETVENGNSGGGEEGGGDVGGQLQTWAINTFGCDPFNDAECMMKVRGYLNDSAGQSY